MRTFSASIQSAIANKRIEHQAFITFADTTTMTVGEDKIWQGGFEIDSAVSGQSAFEVGACVIGEFKLILNNAYGDFDGKAWYGAEIQAQFEAWSDDARTTSLGTTLLGIYYVDEVDTNGTMVKLTCLDAMYKFDIPLSAINPYMYPYPNGYKPYYLLDSCCQAAGVAYGMPNQQYFDDIGLGSGYLIGPLTSSEVLDTTLRDFISMICTVSGCYAYIHPLWGLMVQRLDTSWMKYTGSNYSLYDHHELTSANMTKFNRDEQDVTISGVIIEDTDNTEYTAGTGTYPIKYERNIVIRPIAGVPQQCADGLNSIYNGCTFRPFRATHLSDLSVEAGDNVLITDQWNNVYKSVILHTRYSADGAQDSECVASSENAVRGTRYTAAAKATAEMTASLLPYTDTYSLGVSNTQTAIDTVYSKLNSGYSATNGSSVSVSTATWTDVQTLAVTAGVWIINYGVSFANNATGYRQIALTNSATAPTGDRTMPSANAVNGLTTNIIATMLYEASASETLHVWAYQNSGAARNCWPFIHAVKLR